MSDRGLYRWAATAALVLSAMTVAAGRISTIPVTPPDCQRQRDSLYLPTV